MSREEIVAVRQRLLERQFQPIAVFNWNYPGIPEKDRGKRPSERNWQNTIGMPVYRDDATNTGVLTGTLYPLDIDIEDAAIVAEIVAMAEKLFGRTIVRCRQNSPRRLLPYRIENSDARKIIIQLLCGKLEFLGRGQHFTGFGKHFSGADYEWQDRSLDAIEIEELPIVDPAVIGAFKSWAEARWPIQEKAKPNGDGRTNKGKADFRNTCLVEDVEAALRALPCNYDYGTWVKLGMAYRAGGGSYEVFLEWSQQHRDYQSDDWIDEKWKSFENAHSVTVKTLFKEVFDRVEGWKKPSERGQDYTGVEDDDTENDWEDEDEKDADILDCYDTRRTEFSPLEFAAAPYILAGQLTLISANPKMGKSFLALQIALAIATGAPAFDGQPACKQGAVLYLALEDNQRRMKSRLNKLMRFRRLERGRLMSKYSAKRAPEGFEVLRRWVKRTPDARLIIIDVLALFRRPRSQREEPYAADLEAMTELRKLANDLDVAIIAIMHNRKSEAGADPFEVVSGTMGQTAAAETVLVLRRNGQGGVTLYGRGRDFEEEVETCMEHTNGRWELLGPAQEVMRSEIERKILDALRQHGTPMSPLEIAATIGRSAKTLHIQLFRMLRDTPPSVRKTGRGRYELV